MSTRKINYTIHQRREGATLEDGKYYYVVTTVVSEVRDQEGAPIVCTSGTDTPLLSLFKLDATDCDDIADKLTYETLMTSSNATVEDFVSDGGTSGATPWLDLPRLFFPSASSTNPTHGTPPEIPKELRLNDLTMVIPETAAPVSPVELHDYYATNVRVDVFRTVADAERGATAFRQIVKVFQTRFNEISSSYGTDDGTDINMYHKYDL